MSATYRPRAAPAGSAACYLVRAAALGLVAAANPGGMAT
jgi:hypothetical protein